MAEKSGVQLRFRLGQLPFLDGALQYAQESLFPAGSCSNQDCYKERVDFARGISEEMQTLLFTPETSGGLLIAVARPKLDGLTDLFSEEGQACWVVGDVREGEGIRVML